MLEIVVCTDNYITYRKGLYKIEILWMLLTQPSSFSYIKWAWVWDVNVFIEPLNLKADAPSKKRVFSAQNYYSTNWCADGFYVGWPTSESNLGHIPEFKLMLNIILNYAYFINQMQHCYKFFCCKCEVVSFAM